MFSAVSVDGVGDDAVSWGVFYKSGTRFLSRWRKETIGEVASSSSSPPHKLSKDRAMPTVIAIAVDMDKKEMLLSIDGAATTVVFSNFETSSALVPAFSLQGKISSSDNHVSCSSGDTIGAAVGRGRAEEVAEQIEFEVNFGEKAFRTSVFADQGFRPVLAALVADN